MKKRRNTKRSNDWCPLTPEDLKKLARKKGVKKIDRLTAAEYRELVLSKSGSPKTGSGFSFKYEVEILSETSYKVTVYGKHLSNNRINSISFKDRIRYKNAIKKAVEEFLVVNKEMRSLRTLEGKVEILFVIYGKYSRDYDNNSITLKAIQDTLTLKMKSENRYHSLGIIEDDNRDILVPHPDNPIEVKDKEYKIEAIVKEISSQKLI